MISVILPPPAISICFKRRSISCSGHFGHICFYEMKCYIYSFSLFLWYSLSTICQLYPVVYKLGHVNFVTLWLLVAICTYCTYISESLSRCIKLYRNLLCNLPLLRKFWEFMIVKPKWSWPKNNRSKYQINTLPVGQLGIFLVWVDMKPIAPAVLSQNST